MLRPRPAVPPLEESPVPSTVVSDQLSFEAFADLFAEPLDAYPPSSTAKTSFLMA